MTRSASVSGWDLTDLAGGSTDLTAGPAQTWGAVRLVPLLRREPITNLRLYARAYAPDNLSTVQVGPRTTYVSYVPHAFVASWTRDGAPAATFGTQLWNPKITNMANSVPVAVPLHLGRRMARREDKQRLRFLPAHLALEGYLAVQFGGPTIAWQEWTQRVVSRGLSPRVEHAYLGRSVPGLEDALRVFEIHPDQCGMVLYLADALATIFVVPHPEDYRALHATLLQDFYGELLYQYAHLFPAVPDFETRLDDARVSAIKSVADLRAELARSREEWEAFHSQMAGGLLAAQRLTTMPVYRLKPFTLSRFLPAFDPNAENHIGEVITDDAGRLCYLKTFRLSAAQTRRGYLLSRLAAHEWNLDATATALGTDREGLVFRLDHAGFGYLLRSDIIDACRRRANVRTGAR